MTLFTVPEQHLPGTSVFGRRLRFLLALPGGGRYDDSMLDFAAQYEALRLRDPRWDGWVFVAVETTGIYCRPVCPARTPLARNVRFYRSAAAAEHAGFRPCLRCRPETAPFCPAWKGTRTTVERALRLIESGALDQGSVDQLALNAAFKRIHGRPPSAVRKRGKTGRT